MKTTLLCSFCDDAIDIGDTAICKNCVDELHKNIKKLQARIAELEAALDKAAHQLYDYSGSCPSDLYDWEHPTERRPPACSLPGVFGEMNE